MEHEGYLTMKCRLHNIEEYAQSYFSTGKIHSSCDVRHFIEVKSDLFKIVMPHPILELILDTHHLSCEQLHLHPLFLALTFPDSILFHSQWREKKFQQIRRVAREGEKIFFLLMYMITVPDQGKFIQTWIYKCSLHMYIEQKEQSMPQSIWDTRCTDQSHPTLVRASWKKYVGVLAFCDSNFRIIFI